MTDQLIQPEDVLRALMQIRRNGVVKVTAELETIEPDLAEYVIEETSGIYQDLSATGGSTKQVRRLHERVQALVLVVVLSLRQAHARLWQLDTPADPGDEPLDPTGESP